MRITNALGRMFAPALHRRRNCHRLHAEACALEGRQLLSGPTATMSQTATFPNLESLPNVATQAFLYFSPSMGTLTEVDVATSGTFNTQFAAENLGASNNVITGTTSGNLTINVPSGGIPLSIPAITETFSASRFDGTLDYSGSSGKDFTTTTSSSATQTQVLTSPAALAAFTGQFRIPITVSGHANGSASSTAGNITDSFHTQTSVTITVTYHYDPSLPSVQPTTPAPAASGSTSSGGQGTGSGSGTGTITSSAGGSSSGSTPTTVTEPISIVSVSSTATHKKKKVVKVVAKPAHKAVKAPKAHALGAKGKKHH